MSVRRTRLTGRLYRYPDETRRQRLARYLALRIDRETSAEDQQATSGRTGRVAQPGR